MAVCADGGSSSSSLNKLTICLLGPGESGKSELVKCLIRGNPHMSMSAKGSCSVYGLELNYGRKFRLDVKEYRGSKDTQLRDAMAENPEEIVYYLLYDVTSNKSFKEMRNKWLVSLYPREVLTIVIGNKADMKSEVTASLPDVSDTSWESGHLEISSITGQKVDSLIKRTAEIMGLEVSAPQISTTRSLATCRLESDASLEYYKMDTKPKGICLIISIRRVEDDERYRYGTEKDEANLSELFKSFGFKVHLEVNLEGSEIKKIMKEKAKMDHSKYSCFVCVVMSHGTSTTIEASDGLKVDIDTFTKYFTGSQCESLRGKPKVFFFQACRGNREHESVQCQSDSPCYSPDTAAFIPNESDFLIARSTVDGHMSYRDVNEGSLYISHLVDILKKQPQLSLQSTLIIVQKKIADIDFSGSSGKKVKQMPCFHVSLRKELVLG